MGDFIDLHTHSSASDGTDSPASLVRKAEDAGLAVVALTDHDATSGLEEAAEEARGLSLDFVPGCEISARSDRGSMHILGLWVPTRDEELENFLRDARESRERRNQGIAAKLHALGIHVDLEEVASYAGGECMGRPHFARALVEKGYSRDVKEAFSEYLGASGKAYTPRDAVSPEAACMALAKAGATVILAHPLLHKPDPVWLEAQIATLKKYGLEGLEVWHSRRNRENESLLLGMARRHGLSVSGGTDYHGENKPGISLGAGFGDLKIPRDVYEKLRAARKKRGSPC